MPVFRGIVRWYEGDEPTEKAFATPADDEIQAEEDLIDEAITYLTKVVWGFDGGINREGFEVIDMEIIE